MKNLIQEIHRRSLWQVLGIYLAGSWVALQVVEQLTEAAGLPDWVRPFSLVLLILGFPIVMATAFVQQGMTTATPDAEPQRSASPDEVTAVSASQPSSAHRLFTWRRAVIGGIGAFALLGLLTGGYLFMRATGIGPAGTLVAQGVLVDGAPVVLADFDSSDGELGEVVTGALRIDLLQSPTIRVLERSELAGAMARMQRAPTSSISSEVARELATREGYGAVIEGEVATVGSGYVLSARIVSTEPGTSLAAFRATAKGEDDLIDAIERLSRDIRDKAGESLRSVGSAPPLIRVSTSSLDALRAYTRGETVENSDRPAALALYERAIEIDPEFAMAHRKVAVVLFNLGIRRADEIAAARRAYELRDRLPEAERYLAEAYYHSTVGDDRDVVIRAYENALEVDPENWSALNNLGLEYYARGRLADAEILYHRALTGGGSGVAYTNLARIQVGLGRLADAEATLDRAVVDLPDGAFAFEGSRFEHVMGLAEFDRADSLMQVYGERFGDTPAGIASAASQAYRLALARGQLQAADPHAEAMRLAPGALANPLLLATRHANRLLQRRDGAAAVEVIDDALDRYRDSLPPGDRFYAVFIERLLEAGDLPASEALFEEWKREIPDNELDPYDWDRRRAAEAQLAQARGELDEALRLWDAQERSCPGICASRAALGRAQAFESKGDLAEATAEYERHLASPAVRRSWTVAQTRAGVLEHLAGLYDEQQDLENAAKYYAMFVEQWADADEDLQPRVRAAQSRLEEIVRQRG